MYVSDGGGVPFVYRVITTIRAYPLAILGSAADLRKWYRAADTCRAAHVECNGTEARKVGLGLSAVYRNKADIENPDGISVGISFYMDILSNDRRDVRSHIHCRCRNRFHIRYRFRPPSRDDSLDFERGEHSRRRWCRRRQAECNVFLRRGGKYSRSFRRAGSFQAARG